LRAELTEETKKGRKLSVEISGPVKWFGDPISYGTSKMKLISHSSKESSPKGYCDVEDKEETPEQKEGVFRISQETVNLLKARGVSYLFDFQSKSFTYVYNGNDVNPQVCTGTGKTFYFLAIPVAKNFKVASKACIITVQHSSTIFYETKKEANELAINSSVNQDAQSLHEEVPQKQREVPLKGFRNRSFEELVATSVLAHQLDIPEVDLVIQCSPPKDAELFIHPCGRTGRGGHTGRCICFCQCRKEDQLFHAVRFLDALSSSVFGYFQSPDKLIEERGAVEASAAALPHISGFFVICGIKFLKGKTGVCFDVLTASAKTMQESWKDSKRLQLCVATELPELEEVKHSGDRN
uniref:Helicase C-terminal domain-containing protein n=1 Tax=Erpetoichthys calabaricus TaxID=27687 RepID=A0A8C4SXZ1_ERPCA